MASDRSCYDRNTTFLCIVSSLRVSENVNMWETPQQETLDACNSIAVSWREGVSLSSGIATQHCGHLCRYFGLSFMTVTPLQWTINNSINFFLYWSFCWLFSQRKMSITIFRALGDIQKLSCLTNSSKTEDILINNHTQKQLNLTFEKLELENLWHFFLNDVKRQLPK